MPANDIPMPSVKVVPHFGPPGIRMILKHNRCLVTSTGGRFTDTTAPRTECAAETWIWEQFVMSRILQLLPRTFGTFGPYSAITTTPPDIT
jgi:hypothetical protein